MSSSSPTNRRNQTWSEVTSGTNTNPHPNPNSNSTTNSVDPLMVASSLQISNLKLNGRNYLEWSQSVKLAIDGRGKLGHLTGEVTAPDPTDSQFRTWRSENSLVMAWLLNSMEPTIAKPHMFLATAKEVWDAVRETYSDLENSSQIFEIKSKLWQARQGYRSVTEYYNEMVTWWQELDLCYDDHWENKKDCAQFKKREENDRVFMFLAGVDKNLDEVKGRILG